MAHILPPFRADHVGSFLRTEKIANARNLFNKNLISKEELTKIEDEEIALLVEAEKRNGLKAVTDGEFRRAFWHLDFLASEMEAFCLFYLAKKLNKRATSLMTVVDSKFDKRSFTVTMKCY